MNSTLLSLLIGGLTALSAGLLMWGVAQGRATESPELRLERLTESLHPLEEAELDLPFMERVVKPWFRLQAQAAGRLAPSRNIDKVRQNLMRAGYPGGLNVVDYTGVKLLIGLATGILVLLLAAMRGGALLPALFLAGIVGVIGFLLPDFWLGAQVRKRQKDIVRNLPDALDMLTICVDAGAGLDSAMLKISQKWRNAISVEFGKVVAELRIGLSRRESLQNMANRTNVPELSSFVAVLMQADQYGLSVATVLHTQSEQMRARRWQRAEEEARKVPIKLLFPLVFLVFPAMLAVTIGPAIPALLKTFANMQ